MGAGERPFTPPLNAFRLTCSQEFSPGRGVSAGYLLDRDEVLG